MGAKQTLQATPYIYTGSADKVWAYIKGRTRFWYQKSTRVHLPVISDEHILPSKFYHMRVDTGRYVAQVINVTQMDPKTIVLTIELKRRFIKKKMDYRYGGIVNFIGSARDF